MPGGDRTGPMGMGPRTGRALGYCAGYDAPGYLTAPGGGFGFGRGWWGGGRGLGFRRGRGRGFWRYGGYMGYGAPMYNPYLVPPTAAYVPPTNPENQLEMLKQEREFLENDIKDIQSAITDIAKRIEELEKSK